ncbi:MAG: invasion associated locus B family protein [Aestuariivirgaceae bacterium]
MRKPELVTSRRAAGLAALVVFTAAISAELLAQTAQQQPPSQVFRQFGPRTQKPAGAGQPPAGRQQRAAAPKQTAEVIATHGKWTLTCEKNEVKQPDGTSKKPCAMVQSTQHPERKSIALTLILLKSEKDGKPNTMMRVMAPIGVFLPTGIALEIDGAAVGRVPFTRCLPQVCIAFAEASPPTLEKLKKGGKANFIIYEGPGRGMSLELSLKGFTAGLKKLHEL